MDFLELVKERFSVRDFSDRPVEEEKLEKILLVAKHAPTALNRQPQRIFVLKSREVMEKVSECRSMYGAPCALLVCYDENSAWKNPLCEGYDSGEVDAAICCDEMMLEAWNLGVGSCWIGYFDPKVLSETLQLPENIKPVSLLALGYPAEGCVPTSGKHDVSRPWEELITVL